MFTVQVDVSTILDIIRAGKLSNETAAELGKLVGFGFDFSADDIRAAARLVEWYQTCSKVEYLSVLDVATADRKFHKYEECFRCLRKPSWRSSNIKLSFENTIKLLESQL